MFGLKKYELIIKNIMQYEYTFTTNWDIKSNTKTVLMRHDIDFSVDDAFSLALFENKLNIKSTYFFMLTSNMYNLLSKRNIDTVLKIKEMGHKISLHFDPTVYDKLEKFIEERKIFEEAFDIDLDIISIHRPGSFLKNNNIELFGVRHTYQDQYFREIFYISDSGGKDMSLKLLQFLNADLNQVLHLLIHPVWWVRKLKTQTLTLNKWRREHFETITDEISNNCLTYIK
jgi:hypothetical protein